MLNKSLKTRLSQISRETIDRLYSAAFIITLLLFMGAVSLGFDTPAAHAAVDPDLVGLWHLDNDWLDASGNGNNGTAYNGAVFSAAAQVGSHAGSFDGVDDYVDFGNPANLQLDDPFTVEFWLNKSASVSASSYPAILAHGADGWAVGLNDDKIFVSKSGLPPYLGGNTALANSTWYHVVIVRSGASTTLYLNGKPDGTSVSTPAFSFTNNLTLGFDIGGTPYSGLVDEVAIYDRALSADEIDKSYIEGFGRIGLWHMDNTWEDASGNGNHGTPSGAVFSTDARTGTHAGSFDGVDDYLSIPDSSTLHSERNLTVAGWIYVNAFDKEWQAICWKGDIPDCTTGCDNREFSLWINQAGDVHLNSTPEDRIGIGQLVAYTPQGLIQAGRWHHIAAVISSDHVTMKIYIDGIERASAAYSSSNIRSTIGPLQVGNSPYPGLNTSFNGRIDEFTLYSRALTADEILTEYDRIAPSVSISPVVSPTALSSQTISGDKKSDTTVAVTVNTAAVVGVVTYPTTTSWTCTITGLIEGINDITVTATNAAANSATATASITVVDPDLVGLWRMDGDWLDDSGNGNDGTAINGATFSTNARLGSHAGSFDGVSAYIAVPNSAILNPGSITVSMWLYMNNDPNCDANNNWRSLLHKGSTSGTSTGYDIILEEARNIVWDTGTGTSDRWAPTGVSIPIRTWTHLVLTYDASTGIKRAYQDGILKDNKTVASALPLQSNTNNLLINNPSVSCPYGNGNFNGLIDEVSIYSSVLTAEAINKSYNEGLGRIAHWRMDGDWTDASENGNHGTANGAAFSTDARVGSQAGSFDGIDDYVGVIMDIPEENFTFELWAKTDSSGGLLGVNADSFIGPSAHDRHMYVDANGYACFRVWQGSAWCTTKKVNDGAWHHWAFTVQTGVGQSAYIDGKLVGTNPYDHSDLTGQDRITIGYSADVGYFTGLIDEIGIYNRPLSDDEINRFYNASISRVGLWRMDNDWLDDSGNGNDGTAINGATFSTNARLGSHAGGFDGVDDYVIIPDSISLNPQHITVETWFKAATFANGNYTNELVNKGVNYWDNGYYGLAVDSTGLPYAVLNIGAGADNAFYLYGVTGLAAGSWNHLAMTYDNSVLRLYVNGIPSGAPIIINRTRTTNTGVLTIGRLGGGGYHFNGLIDEAAVYDLALSAAEILTLYNTTPPAVYISSPNAEATYDNTPFLKYSVSSVSSVTTVVKVDGDVVNKVSGNSLDMLTDGQHTVRVEATDAVGSMNVDEVTFTVDTINPTVTITAPAAGTTHDDTPLLTYSVSEGATVTVKVDNVVISKASGASLDPIADGLHTVRVEAVDALGNTGIDEVTFTVDGVTLSDVGIGSHTIDTSVAESSTIFFTLDMPATVTLKIIPEVQGPSGTPIYQASQVCAAAGAYSFTWAGRDSITGSVVPDEAYLYILEATDNVSTAIYSPDQPAGTGTVTCSGDSYDPVGNDPLEINYSLSQPARVDFIVQWYINTYTIMDAVPHVAGNYTYQWNGRAPDGRMLDETGSAQCAVASLLRENFIITSGDTPKVTNLKTDPYSMHLSYGQFTRITYTLSHNANVTVSLIASSGESFTLQDAQAQSPGDYEIPWDGIDWADPYGKKFVLTTENDYTVSITAVNPDTGTSFTARGNLRLWR